MRPRVFSGLGGSELVHTLDGSEADAASGGMDEDVVTSFDTRANHQGAVACGGGHEQPRGLLVAPTLGHGQHADLLGDGLGGIGALGGAEDARADGELGVLGVGGGGQHDARELGARDPREGWVLLAFDSSLVQRGDGRGSGRAYEAGVGISPGSEECQRSLSRRRAPRSGTRRRPAWGRRAR